MRLVSRPRALHIKNIQMPSPPGAWKRGTRASTATRARIYGLHGAIVQIMFMKQCSGRRPPFSSSRCSYPALLVYYVYTRVLYVSGIVEYLPVLVHHVGQIDAFACQCDV